MHKASVFRLCGILVILFSLSFIPSFFVSMYFHDGEVPVFGSSFAIAILFGLALWAPVRHRKEELSVRDGFLTVVLLWVMLGVVGALPYMIGLHLNLTDAMFESVSGFTTTGATVVTGLDNLPLSILYHRQQTQWIGGMGIIVLAVAILPWLGIGGMQLFQAEASGVAKHEKLTPRIAKTGRALWSIYLIFTAVNAAAFWLAGMSPFDAIGHAFTTISTGGFSTHDESIAYFQSPLIESITIIFMLAGGVNFAIHFLAFKRLTLLPYFGDPEVRSYVRIFFWVTLFVAVSLYLVDVYGDAAQSLRHSAFQTASIMTSTGFTTANFSAWPLHVPLVLVMVSFIGGCAGSTAGGIKVVRLLVLIKLGVRQLFQLAYPNSVYVVKLGDKPIEENILLPVVGFWAFYVITALILTTGMMAAGLDLESAFGAVVATINLLGPGLGDVAANFTTVGPVVKWLGVFGMLFGRLEVFTLLILFLPAYWGR